MGGVRARSMPITGPARRAWRSAAGTAAVAVALTTLLAGCGSATMIGGTAAAATGGAAAGGPIQPADAGQHGGPAAGSRAAALRLDRQLLSALVLPPGARPVRIRLVPRSLRQPGDALGTPHFPELRRLFVLGQRMRAAERFLVAHPPARMTIGDTTEGADGSVVTCLTVSFVPRSLPHGIYQSELDLTVVPGRHGGAFLRADAQSVWYPPRSAAEHLSPAGFVAVTVSARRVYTGRHQVRSRTFTSRRVIAGLTALLNGLPASPDLGALPCAEQATSYRVAFTRSAGGRPAAVVTSGSCQTDQITVGGRAQPALEDSGKLGAAVSRLLG